MEAVPRLPMISFQCKISTEATTFGALKMFIADFYQENPDNYSREIHQLEALRGRACRPTEDMDGLATMKRYYCQLHSLQNRFPIGEENAIFSFSWRELHSPTVWQDSSVRYEMAVILFNIAAMLTTLGAKEDRTSPESMKVACTHFQCAAWAYGHIKEMLPTKHDMTMDLLTFMQNVAFAQAQECILEKSLADNRKPSTVAKVTAQIVSYYNSAMAALMSSVEGESISDVVGSKTSKAWKRYVKFKVLYLTTILYLYQGMQAEEAKKYGERVTYFQAAFERLEEATKESKGIENIEAIKEALIFTMDVVEGKRKNAKSENDFIYHEETPDLAALSAVPGANLVNGIGFNVTDPEVAGEDIFHRLVPMKAHESSSIYSEEKATLLRRMGERIAEKDEELGTFMSSLNVDAALNITGLQQDKVPQGLVDRCAALNAKSNAIPDLVASMHSLAETCVDVESMLNEIRALLQNEDRREEIYQQKMGQRPPGGHMSELNREFQKYLEAHSKAGESNETLRKAMELHVANLRTLSQPLSGLRQAVPRLDGAVDESALKDLQHLVAKVDEMRAQRQQLYAQLREAVAADDITSQVIAWGDKKLEKLFAKELAKHDKTVQLIDQNLAAQANILKALTEIYARCATVIKAVNETKTRRDQFFSSLAASYDVYEDLLGKSAKGLEFYKKLQGNVQKLLSRVKAATEVQDEERQQRLKSVAPPTPPVPAPVKTHTPEVVKSTGGGGPKLKDYLNAGFKVSKNVNDPIYIPPVRPSPLGSESVGDLRCPSSTAAPTMISYDSTNSWSSYAQQQQVPIPPYAPQGYTNPIYQPEVAAVYYGGGYQQPTDVKAPPQRPSSQDSALNQSISNLSLNSAYPAMYSATQQPDSSSYTSNYVYSQPQVAPSYNPATFNQFYGQQAATTTTFSQNYAPSSYTQPTTSTLGPIQQPSGTQPVAQSYGNQNLSQVSTDYSTQQQFYAPNYPYSMANQVLSQPQAPIQTYSTSSGQIQQPQTYSTPVTTFASPAPAEQPTYSTQNGQIQPPVANYPVSSTSVDQQGQIHPYNYPYSMANQPPTIQPQLQPTEPQSATSTAAPPTLASITTPYDKIFNQYYGQNTASTATPDPQYNPQTAVYSYGSGQPMNTNPTQTYNYHYAGTNDTHTGGSTTDSTNLGVGGQSYVSQYAAVPTVANIVTSVATTTATTTTSASSGTSSYYRLPYGLHSSSSIEHTTPAVVETHSGGVAGGPAITYMSSNSMFDTSTSSLNSSLGPTMTSYESPQPAPQSPAPAPAQPQPQPQPPQQPAPAPTPAKSTSLDLLSGIDFAPAPVSIPLLQPKPAAAKKDESDAKSTLSAENEPLAELKPPSTPVHATATPLDRKSSMDNLSIASDLSSLAENFDWESASLGGGVSTRGAEEVVAGATPHKDAFDDPKVLKWFHKEVERHERFVETLTVKTLNGTTPLDGKWKELQDLLVKDEGKRAISVARLFPEKNRSFDSVPYDHARVQLPRETDDYINAGYVKDLGAGCPTFIIAQTPLQNTVNDFWSMIWSEKSNTVVCLHTPNEILDPFWPQEIDKTLSYGDYDVTLLKQFDLSHCIERSVKLNCHGSDETQYLSVLQLKSWVKNSANHIIGIASNIITSWKQQNQNKKQIQPLIINCLTGSERSGIVTMAIACILATQTRRPILINVVDVWYRICSQRKGALRDVSVLQLSFQIVLNHAYGILNKHGIMTSYQMKNEQQKAQQEKEEAVANDPFKDLDPLWKLK